VHADEHVRLVAGRVDLLAREVELVTGHAGERAGGSADLGREVRERREGVAVERGRLRELGAGQLHAVTRVTDETDHDRFAVLDQLRRGDLGRRNLVALHESLGSCGPSGEGLILEGAWWVTSVGPKALGIISNLAPGLARGNRRVGSQDPAFSCEK